MRRIALFLLSGLLLGSLSAPLPAPEGSRRLLDPFFKAIREHNCDRIREMLKHQPGLLQHLTLGRLRAVIEEGDPPTVTCLLDNGLAVDALDDTGRTLLHWAAADQKSELITLLLARRADPNRADQYGTTPMLLACIYGTPGSLAPLLAAGGDLSVVDTAGNGAVHFAMMQRGDPVLLQMLSDRRCPLDQPNGQGQSPLMLGCSQALPGYLNAKTTLTDNGNLALSVRDPGIAWLLEHQADIRRQDKTGGDMLHYAIRGNRLSLVQACLAAGAETKLKDSNGLTPLDYALLLNATPDLIARLTQEHAPAPYTDPLGNNHLHMRVAAHWTAAPLAGQTAPPNSHTCDPVVPLLLEGGFDPNATNHVGQTALHRACEGTNLDSATVLLQYGADPNRTTGAGVRPLDIAAARHDLDMLRLLLAHGADPRLTDAGGLTALERQLTIALPEAVRERLAADKQNESRYRAEIQLLYRAQQGLPLTLCWIGMVLGLLAAAQALRLRAARLQRPDSPGAHAVEPPPALWHGADWKLRIGQFEQARHRHAEQLRLRAWPWLALGALGVVIALHALDPLLRNSTPAAWIPPFLACAGICVLMQAGMYWNRRAVRAWLAIVALIAIGVLTLLLGANSYVVAVQMGFWPIGLLTALGLPALTAAGWAYYRILVIDRAILAFNLPGDLHSPPRPLEPEDIESHHGWDERGEKPET